MLNNHYYGVLGHPVAQSLSPVMFEAAFWQYNLEAEYSKFDVADSDLKEFIIEAKKTLNGLSVTIPYKEVIKQYLNSEDEKAELIGAVNTVVNNKGKLKGYNTDWIGAQKALEEVVELAGKRVVVLGAGGAAAAIVYACVQAGAQVTILNRTIEKAQQLANRFTNCKADTLDAILRCPAEVLIHTTSVGMKPNLNESLVPPGYFKKGMVVFDVVYNPAETRLVRDARAAGCKIVPGYKMLLYQAEKQFELWFKKRAPLAAMEKALLDALK